MFIVPAGCTGVFVYFSQDENQPASQYYQPYDYFHSYKDRYALNRLRYITFFFNYL